MVLVVGNLAICQSGMNDPLPYLSSSESRRGPHKATFRDMLFPVHQILIEWHNCSKFPVIVCSASVVELCTASKIACSPSIADRRYFVYSRSFCTARLGTLRMCSISTSKASHFLNSKRFLHCLSSYHFNLRREHELDVACCVWRNGLEFVIISGGLSDPPGRLTDL